MKTALTLVAVATGLVAPRLAAQEASIPAVIQMSDGEPTPTVQLYLTRGDTQSTRLRFDAAAREYRRAADVARHEGHLASGTTWKLATAYYYNGDFTAAAAALDQLSNEASRVGDLGVEALSIYYAAWLDGKAGLKTEVSAHLTRLESLLHSQYMPVALRDELTTLLRASKEVALQ